MINSLHEASKIIRGSYAFVVLIDGDNSIYASRCASPMIAVPVMMDSMLHLTYQQYLHILINICC